MRSSSQLPFLFFFSHYISVLVFSFGVYTSNQFSELSLFHFRKGQMKIRNVLFIFFCRFVCFCCHHSLLINFIINISNFILKVLRYLGPDLIKIQCFLCLIKQDSVTPFLFPLGGFCIIWHCCIIFHRDHIYFIKCFMEIFYCMVF